MEEGKAESVKATSPDASFVDEMDIPEPTYNVEEIEKPVEEEIEEPLEEIKRESNVIQKVSEINKPTTQEEEKDDWGVLNFLKW